MHVGSAECGSQVNLYALVPHVHKGDQVHNDNDACLDYAKSMGTLQPVFVKSLSYPQWLTSCLLLSLRICQGNPNNFLLGIHLVIISFLVSIKSFFPTENILENIVPTSLQQVLHLSAWNLQKVSENWIKSPCQVTIQSSDYHCQLHQNSLSYTLLHNKIAPMKFVTNALVITKSLSHVNMPKHWEIMLFSTFPHHC